MNEFCQKLIRGLSIPLLGLALAGCSIGQIVGSPTPEPFTMPTVVPTEIAAATPVPTAVVTTTDEGRTVAVQRGNIRDIRVLNGQVSPVLERELAFRQSGVIRRLYVDPGMSVTAGTLLAELDLGTLQEQLRQAQIVAEQDAVAISRANEGGSIEVRRAELALEEARAALSELQTPPSAQAVSEARARVERAEAALARTRNDASAEKTRAERELSDAKAELERLQVRYAELVAQSEQNPATVAGADLRELEASVRAAESAVAVAQINYDTAFGNEIASLQAAQADVDLARVNLDQLIAGPDPFQIAEAERAVRLAGVQLDAARQNARPDPRLVVALSSSQLAVKEIENAIETRRIYAPFDGTITAVEAMASFPVQAEIPVIRLMDNSGFEVTLSSLDQATLNQITSGMPVQISFTRYPERQVAGTVRMTSAGTMAGGGSMVAVSYNAPELNLGNDDLASVTFDFGEQRDVLWLPPEALRRDTTDYVLRIGAGTEERIDVVLGAVSDERIEIRAGLREGEAVALP